MKRIILTKTTWALLITGSVMFGACKDNNSSSTAQNTDTSASVVPLNGTADNGLTGLSGTTSPTTAPTTADGTATTTTATSTSGQTTNTETAQTGVKGCPVPVKHKAAYRRYAYTNRHKLIRHKTKISTTTEENTLVTNEPPAPITTRDEDVVTVDKTITPVPETPAAQTENVYFGNTPTTTAKKPAMVHIGLEAGPTLNNLYRMSDDFQTSNMLKVGFNAGVMMNVRMGDHFAVEPGLRYIMKGGLIKSNSSDGVNSVEQKDKLTFHYIELPLNLVYNTGEWGNGRFMIGAGPYVSYLVNAQDKSKTTTTNIYEGTTVTEGQQKLPVGDPSTTGNVRNWDAGAGAFIGYQMQSGVYLKAGGEVGLLDLQKNTNTLGNFYDRNYNFLFSVGYMMGYNK